MQLQHVRRSLVPAFAALAAGALGGYLAALLRPRQPLAYASAYTAPHPDLVALTLEPGDEPAVDRAPTTGAADEGPPPRAGDGIAVAVDEDGDDR